jgi:hypothetical protein
MLADAREQVTAAHTRVAHGDGVAVGIEISAHEGLIALAGQDDARASGEARVCGTVGRPATKLSPTPICFPQHVQPWTPRTPPINPPPCHAVLFLIRRGPWLR